MRRFLMTLFSAGLAVVLVGNLGVADEPSPDKLRAKAEHLQRDAEMLFCQAEEMERGHRPDAPHHEPPPIEEMHRHIGHLKEKIEHLHHEGRHEEAEGLEREVQEIRRKIEEMERGRGPEPPHHGPPHDPEHRARMLNEAAEHMLEAAKRLHEADVHELAEELSHEAEKVREEAHRQMHAKEAHQVIDELKHEIGKLRHDLDRLRGQMKEAVEAGLSRKR